jgi:hypothetical protein
MAEEFNRTLIENFRDAVRTGENWYLALLEAAARWPADAEEANGESYRYIIAGEALDLTQIAERLVESAKDLIPEEQQINLLFRGKPPLRLSPEELKARLGEEKYKQHLNYFYGVTVEEALQEVTSEEVRKEERGIRARTDAWIAAEAFCRVYGKTQPDLLILFRAEKGYPDTDKTSLAEMKEFNYWLFKYRLAHSDPEKSASDTKKALGWLGRYAR